MADNIKIQQQIQAYKNSNPKLKNLSEKQVASIMIKNGSLKLTAEQRKTLFPSKNNTENNGTTIEKKSTVRSITLKSGCKIIIKNGQTHYYAEDGVELNQKYFEKTEGKIDVKPSGRYSVTKNGQTKYYAANGTELKESYFNQVESSDVKIKTKDGKTYNLNKTLEKRINNVSANVKKAEDENGFMGKAWSGFKNLTGIGDSSDKVREQQAKEKKLLAQFNSNAQNRAKIFEELTGQKYTDDNLEKFIKGQIKLKSEIALQGYKEGQEMAVDVGADIVSGIAAVGIYSAAVAAAPFTGGASIAVGVAAAGVSGAAIKTGLKVADAATGGRKYTLKDAGHDAATGAFSGVLAPITGGMGGAVGKTVATKLGIQAVKTVGKEVAEEVVETGVKQGLKQGIKTALTNPTGYEYVGGNIAKRAVAMSAEMASDGAVGGAVDNAFRTALDGGSLSDVAQAAGEGFVGGAIMSPIIGGGFKAVGKAGHELGSKVKGGSEVAADAVETSLTKNADNIVPNPKSQIVKTKKMSDKELRKNIIDKMGKKRYDYYKKLNNKFFTDSTNLRILNNYLTENPDKDAYNILNSLLYSLDTYNPKLKNVIADLSDTGMKSNNVLKYLREFDNLKDIYKNKSNNLSNEDINSILNLYKSGVDSDSLLSFIKLKMDNPNTKSIDLLKNYDSIYSQHSHRLNTMSSGDFINEFRILLTDTELDGHNITRNDLKEIISNIKTEKNSNLNNDELILANFDKKMFEDMVNIIDQTPLKESESITDYFTRIDKIRKEQIAKREIARFNRNKAIVEQNYVIGETKLDEIVLNPEETAKFNSKKDYYISKAGDPSTKQGMGISYSFEGEHKLLALGLQQYERYNSTRYFAQNSGITPYGKTGEYKYPPVIRFLDVEKSRFKTAHELVESFPTEGDSYQAKALKCCFTTPIGSKENLIMPDVIIEIHPLAETSKGHLIGGWGREVRYGGNQKFKVIDKYCTVEEHDFGCGIKRMVIGHVILQEL